MSQLHFGPSASIAHMVKGESAFVGRADEMAVLGASLLASVSAAGEHAPALVLVADDLHWADAAVRARLVTGRGRGAW